MADAEIKRRGAEYAEIERPVDQLGKGLFAAPSAIDDEVQKQYRVRLVGRLSHVRERILRDIGRTQAQTSRGHRNLRIGKREFFV